MAVMTSSPSSSFPASSPTGLTPSPTAPSHSPTAPRLPAWTPELKPQPAALVDTILARRQGRLLNLDHVLLWSEPVASGWNTFMGNVRTKLSVERKWLELGICTVALLTHAQYEYHHHRPDFLVRQFLPAGVCARKARTLARPHFQYISTARDDGFRYRANILRPAQRRFAKLGGRGWANFMSMIIK